MATEILEAEIKTNIGDVTKDVKKLDKETKKTEKGFNGMKNAISGVGSALKAVGIGIVVGLLAKLGEVFSQNQKVLDFFNVSMEVLSLAFNDLFKYLSDNVLVVAGYLKTLFTDPLGELEKLAVGIDEFLINKLKGAKLILEGIKIALLNIGNPKKYVEGMAKIAAGTAIAGKNIAEVFDKLESKITNYTKGLLTTAKTTVALRKESELAAVMVQGLIEDYDRQAEKLRQVRDDETKTFEERIKANKDLGDVLKEQEVEMLKLVDIQIASAKADVLKNDSLENQIKLQETLNAKKAVLAQITGFESEQIINNISLNKEQKAVAEENAEAQLTAFSDLAGALSELAGDNKALAVAAAIIDTYAGANKAFAQGGTVGFVTGAAVIAAGLNNVRTIMAQDVGGGGGGGGGASGGSAPAPQMMSGAFELTGASAPEPTRAYVVTDDMTNSQNQLANIRRRATI